MSTPASVVATGSSRWVTSLVQPPSSIRVWAREKGNFMLGSVPASVGGGVSTSGFWRSSSTLRGPVSVPPWPFRCG
jgi:hypothetical protein